MEKALKAKGFQLEARDHRVYWLVVPGIEPGVYTKVSSGTKHRDLGDPLIKLMAEQMHLSKQEFLRFVECSMSAAQYLHILREKGIVPPPITPNSD